MGNREVHEEPDLRCDICGAKGAYDFYGDAICQKCIDDSKSKSRAKRIVAQKKPGYKTINLEGWDGAECFKGMTRELYTNQKSSHPISQLTFLVTLTDYEKMVPYFCGEPPYRIQPFRFTGVLVFPMVPRYAPVDGLRDGEIWLADLRETEQTDYYKPPKILLKGVGFDFV